MLVLYALITLGIPAALIVSNTDIVSFVTDGVNALLRAGQRGQTRLERLDQRHSWFAPTLIISLFVSYVIITGFLGS